MKITVSYVRDILITSNQNERAKFFSFRIRSAWFFANFNPGWISWPSCKVLEKRRKCSPRYLCYINESKVQNMKYSLVFEGMTFLCFWWGLLNLQMMTSSVWLTNFDLEKVKFRPNCFQSRKEKIRHGHYLIEIAGLINGPKLTRILI